MYYANNQNQVDNEELVCSYIYSLKYGTYSQDGEIVIGGSPSYSPGGISTTGGQKFALTFFIVGTVGLAVYAAMLHSQLTKGGKADTQTLSNARFARLRRRIIHYRLLLLRPQHHRITR